MPLQRADVEQALAAKGFRLKGGDHRFYHLYVGEERQAIFTKVSTGSEHRTIGDDLLAQMARQTKLTKAEFTRLVECSLSGPAYVELLRGRGLLAPTRPPQPAASPAAKSRSARRRHR